MSSLEGKVAMVTGAASKRGMGHSVALKLAREGADLVIADKFSTPKSLFPGDEGWGGLNAEVAEIKALGREARAMVVDITKSQEIDEAVSKTVAQFGGIDILVHCAGIRGPVGIPAHELAEQDWRMLIEINLNGSFFVSRAVAKQMVAGGKGGKIVLISSMAGIKGAPGSAAYAASKHGVIGLAKSMALELAKYKINVNAINPGAFVTNLRDEAFSQMGKAQGITPEEARQADYKKANSAIPMGRLGTPEEIADLAYFLVSEQSKYITGEAIVIGGGIN
jgi:3-oxoacyl-[acyl-carrier protein] reductase/meso-butanediol dehydrogenase/(S,S)-butanediol dehydrogenase/diacetyl reductase